MASFNGNIGTPSDGFNLKVDYNLSAVNDNISTNATKIISIVGQVKRNNSSYYPYNSTKSASIKIEKQNESGSWETVKTISVNSGSYSFNDNNYQTWVSGSNISIAHKNNGTQKIRITFSVDGKLSSYYPVGSISKEIDLPTIPRASDIAVSNTDLGQNIPITIGKKVDSFTSTLTYTIGTLTGTIVEKTNLSNYPWVMTSTLINQIKNAYPNTGSYAKGGIEAKITCKTYNGTTLIGSKEATFKLYITDKPVISSVTRTELNSNILALTTNVLRHASQNKFTISANAPTGAKITGYRVKNGTQDSGLSTSNVVKLNDIQTYYEENNALKTKFIVTCVDSRGNESEEYPVICDFTNYIQVSINKTDVSIKRSSGTSTDCKIYLTGNFFNGKIGTTDNIISFKVRYKLREETEYSSWITLSTTYTGNTFKVDNVAIAGTFDYTKNYDFELLAGDKINDSDSCNKIFANARDIVKFHKNGADFLELTVKKTKVVTVNQLGDLNNLTTDNKTSVVNAINSLVASLNSVVSSNTNENGTYIKYSNGQMECYKNIIYTANGDFVADGSIFYKQLGSWTFPQEFVEIPNVQISVVNTVTSRRAYGYLSGEISKTKITNYGVINYWNATDSDGIVCLVARGKWK